MLSDRPIIGWEPGLDGNTVAANLEGTKHSGIGSRIGELAVNLESVRAPACFEFSGEASERTMRTEKTENVARLDRRRWLHLSNDSIWPPTSP